MNNPLISIIVPIYGVEQYLDRCVDSIVNQSYQNLEIILVDDGSPDKCPAMCDEWAEKDSRIKVIHKENGGLSDARNAGMAIATGELMGFVDSDDYIAPEMYRLLYENMVETDSDISCCGVEMVWEDGTPSRMLTKTGCCVLNREEAMEAIIEESWLKHPVTNRLYRRACIGAHCFPVGKTHEDAFWSPQVIANACRVSVMGRPCYFYWQRCGSIMGQAYSEKRLDLLEAYKEELSLVQSQFPALESRVATLFCFRVLYGYQSVFRMEEGPERNRCLELLREYREAWTAIKDRGRPRGSKQRLWYTMAVCSVEGTAKVRNRFNVGF